MTDPRDSHAAGEQDFAIAARTRIEARNRERERRAARSDRRTRILLWLCAPLLLPAAGTAAALAVLDADSDRLGLALAAIGVPPLITAWLARRRGVFELVAWPLITVAAELAAVFWVGFVWLGYGPE